MTNSNQGRDSPVPRQPPDVVCPLSIWVSESQAVQAYPVVHLVRPGTAAGEARSCSDPGLTPRGSCAGPRCKVDGTSLFTDKVKELEVASALSYAAIRLEQAAGGKE